MDNNTATHEPIPSTRTFVKDARIELLPLSLFSPPATTAALREYQEQVARHEVMRAVNTWLYTVAAEEEEECPPTLRSAQ